MFKNSILSICMLFCYIFSFAQEKDCTIELKGRIFDADTKLPMSGVSVTLSPSNRQTMTDGHGYFSFRELCAGSVEITVSSLGYTDEKRHLQLTSNQTINFQLTHSDVVLHDVEVIGHAPTQRSTAKIISLSEQQMDESRGENLAQALSKIAGVSTLNTGSNIAKPVINGMHSNRVLIMNNGIRQEGQQWGAEHAPEIDPFTAKKLSVVKGAESVRYGADAIGGVVLVDPAPMPIDKTLGGELHAVGASNGRSGTFSGTLEGNIKKWNNLAWRAQGTYKKAGSIKTANYYLGNTGVNEIDFSTALSYNTPIAKFDAYYSHYDTELGIFTGAHIGTLEDIQAIIDNGRPFLTYDFSYDIASPRQRVKHDLAKLKAHHDFANGASLDVQYAFQRDHRQEYDIRRGDRDAIPSLNLQLTTQSMDISYDHLKSNGLRTIVGTSHIMQVNNNIPGTLTIPIIPNYDSYTGGIYGIERLVKNHYELEAGLRYDYKYFDAAGYRLDLNNPTGTEENYGQELYGGTRTFHNITGSLGAVWHPNAKWDLRSNLGLAWRPPSANELYSSGLHHGAALYEIGDDQLQSERSYKWVNSAHYEDEKWRFDIDLYGQYIHDYIYAQPSSGEFIQTVRGTFPVFRYEQSNARFWGLDLNAQYQINTQLNYHVNAAMVRAKNVSDGTYLPYIPSDRVTHGLRWEVPATNQEGTTRWTSPFIQVDHQYVARQSRYEPESDYAAPPAAYHLFNAVAGIKYKANSAHTLGMSLGVDNLTNTLYKDYMNRFRYYTHEMGRNITLRIQYIF